jgi:hypothetical protein
MFYFVSADVVVAAGAGVIFQVSSGFFQTPSSRTRIDE